MTNLSEVWSSDSSKRWDCEGVLGTLRAGDSSLDVSTGGFTCDAETEAEHSHQPITLLDREAFIRLLLEYYENLEAEYKAWVPTTKGMGASGVMGE